MSDANPSYVPCSRSALRPTMVTVRQLNTFFKISRFRSATILLFGEVRGFFVVILQLTDRFGWPRPHHHSNQAPTPGTSGMRSDPPFISYCFCKTGSAQSCHSNQCGFSNAHDMRGHFRVKVGGHRDTGRPSYRGCLWPAGHAANAHAPSLSPSKGSSRGSASKVHAV
jgi:hypothetical protein